MTLAQFPTFRLRRPRVPLIALAIFGLALLALFSARAVAQGWLIAFVFWSGIGIGSLVWMLIHRLTGGRWGKAASGVFIPAALTLPLATIAFIPLAFALSGPYDWAAGTAHIPPDVARFYLNQPAFLVRSFLALFGWSALALVVFLGRCTRLIAAIGLAFYGFAISLLAVDWILSIETGFGSSAFAAGFAFQQMLSALAFAAMVTPEKQSNPALADLSGLLLTTLLGTVYVKLMSFIVSWYGDLPEKAQWYLRREHHGWEWVIAAAVVFGAILPFAILLRADLRENRTAVRIVGVLVLVGIFLHVVWLMAPTFETSALPAALVALIALGCLSISFLDAAGVDIGKSADG